MAERGRPREVDALRAVFQVRTDHDRLAAWHLAANTEDRKLADVTRELLDRWAEEVLTGART